MRQFVQRLDRMHRAAVWVVQIFIFALSAVAAFILRFDLSIPSNYLPHLAYGVAIWAVIKSVVFRVTNLDRGWWRYVSLADILRIALGNAIASAASYPFILYIAPRGFPRSIYLLDFLICLLATGGIRIIVRMAAEEATSRQRNTDGNAAALIYGAGEAGITLLREIRKSAKMPYSVKGFLDDRPDKKGVRILGTPVLGGREQLDTLVKKHHIEMILIAIPSATGEQMTKILERCHTAGVACKMVPALADVVEHRGLVGEIRDVAVEDLLGRSPARLDQDKIRCHIEGSVIVVSGAAGSIGSELCRQIARFHPRTLVGFDNAETPLFHLDREMNQSFPDMTFCPEIGSVQNTARLDEMMQQYSPSMVFHAAAYKHVPMMERHIFEAVENNVFGTHNLAAAAARHDVETFVLISSDKAVRPTNIMGATKRLAELVVLGLQGSGTNFVAVRFGNVLGSNGSVVPLFKEQIAAGGPVKVTHPEMRRYFMTIPEAAQLVLQASTMGRGGEVFVLDMDQPVKIVDLARKLILLSGLRVDEDIKIEFTGMRPGEKLYEELSLFEESTVPTHHEKIRIFTGNGLPKSSMETYLQALRQLAERRDLSGLVLTMKEIVPDYNPSTNLLERAMRTPSWLVHAYAQSSIR